MTLLNRYNISFFLLLFLHLFILIIIADNFSISEKEAMIFFNDTGLLSTLTNSSVSIFGQNDIALRLPFIIFYGLSAALLYLLTDDYFKSKWDRLFCLWVFLLLPGLNSAALLINESIIVVFGTLLYLYLYKVTSKEHYYILAIYLFVDNSFAILFLALFFYSLKKKDNTLLIVSLPLFGISMSMYGFEIGGRPRGYFLDTFGIYATIFSPLLFLYFFYSLYRIGIKWDKDMYWYISITALFLSLLFSLRQKIDIEDFAPFVVIAIPIMVRLFLHSLRVRLKQFRRIHYIISSAVISILVLNFFILVFNKYLYLLIDKPTKHFAYKHHIAKELAQALKNKGIDKIIMDDYKTLQRLKFYNINKGNKYYLTKQDNIPNTSKLEIKYHGKTVSNYYYKKL